MKKWLLILGFIGFVSQGKVWAGPGSRNPDTSGFKAINSAVTEAVYYSSSTSDINGGVSAPIGTINNSTISATSGYLYAVVIASPGSPGAVFNVYDTSGNWANGTRSLTGWVSAGNDIRTNPLPPLNASFINGLGYTSSGTVPAKLIFLYRER